MIFSRRAWALAATYSYDISVYCSRVSYSASVDKTGKRVTGDRNNLIKDYKINGNMMII